MDGEVFGPYSAKGMMELDVLPDIMVTEDAIDTWQPAGNFDFASLAKEEVIERLKLAKTNDATDTAVPQEDKRAALKRRLENAGNIEASETISKNTVYSQNQMFPQSIEYKANFNEGLNSIGGKIIITPTQLIFHAHSLNFGDLRDRIFDICRIAGYEKGILTFMYIKFNDGSKIKLTVWSKDEIINQLEARRTSLLNKYH